MIAARIAAAGADAEAIDVPEPVPGAGEVLVRLRAAGLNPVDLAIAAGRFYLPVPSPPFVAGAEAVGEVIRSGDLAPGTRVWGLVMTGAFADVWLAPADRLVPVPAGLADETAVAIGVAGLAGWMAVRERGGLRRGETVCVLGASGVVGQVAVQAARGIAGRVVAVARSVEGLARARDLGADATVTLGDGDLAAGLARAAPAGIDLIVDMLWGAPARAALGRANRGGRLVQVGNSAGPETPIVAGPLRGGRLDIRGMSLFSEDFADVAAAYGDLADAAATGAVEIATETIPLTEVGEAWRRQAAGTGGTKLVLVP